MSITFSFHAGQFLLRIFLTGKRILFNVIYHDNEQKDFWELALLLDGCAPSAFYALGSLIKAMGAETMAFFYLGAMKKSWPFLLK